MDSQTFLSGNLFRLVLSYLPADQLIKCMDVSKAWKAAAQSDPLWVETRDWVVQELQLDIPKEGIFAGLCAALRARVADGFIEKNCAHLAKESMKASILQVKLGLATATGFQRYADYTGHLDLPTMITRAYAELGFFPEAMHALSSIEPDHQWMTVSTVFSYACQRRDYHWAIQFALKEGEVSNDTRSLVIIRNELLKRGDQKQVDNLNRTIQKALARQQSELPPHAPPVKEWDPNQSCLPPHLRGKPLFSEN